MKTLYAILCGALLTTVGLVNFFRARTKDRPTPPKNRWVKLFAKTGVESVLAIGLGMIYPPLLVGFCVLWMTRGINHWNPYLVAAVSTILAGILALASKQALEILILLGALSLGPLVDLSSYHFGVGLRRAEMKNA